MPEKSPSAVPLLVTYGGLLVLLGGTLLASRWHLGPFALAVALGFAAAKTGLILVRFMHLGDQGGLVRLFALAGYFWLAVAIALTLVDFLNR